MAVTFNKINYFRRKQRRNSLNNFENIPNLTSMKSNGLNKEQVNYSKYDLMTFDRVRLLSMIN
ncbi:MAG: hypothetical protein ACW99A_16685 [Candidatus Kariarchaeaceae archaeon]|jgi:hypothetical protein